jgi:hypothetical protein
MQQHRRKGTRTMKKFGRGRFVASGEVRGYQKKYQKQMLHGSHGRYGSLVKEPTERMIFTRRYAEKKEPAR